MKNKKRIITEHKCDRSTYDFEGTLEDVRERIDEWIQSYGPKARLGWDPYFHYPYESQPSPRYNILVDREETDEEYNARVEKENAANEARRQKDLAEFERLKKLYDNK